MKKLCLITLLSVAPGLATAAHAANCSLLDKSAISRSALPVAIVSTPEPASLGILAAGGVALLVRRRSFLMRRSCQPISAPRRTGCILTTQTDPTPIRRI